MKTGKALLVSVAASAAFLSHGAGLSWAKDFKTALRAAKSARRTVMVDFTAVWCVNCHKLDRTTYKDPAVVKLLASAVPVQVDFDKQPALAAKYKVVALPVILFLDANGKEVGRISKYVDAKEFLATATPILAKAKK